MRREVLAKSLTAALVWIAACSSTSKQRSIEVESGAAAAGGTSDGGGQSGASGSSSGGSSAGGAMGSSTGGDAGSSAGGVAGSSAGTGGTAGGAGGTAGNADAGDATAGTAGCGNTTSDPLHCGACGMRCPTGERCYESVCRGNDVEKAVASSLPCVLTKAGTVHCWGTNQYGQVGVSVAGNVMCGTWPCRPNPTRVEGLPKAKDVAVGLDFACAVTTAGKVMCWGRNEFGQLGHNPATDDSCGEPCNARPTEVAGISNAKGVAAGRWNACAWTEAGALYCWGRNDEGVVGNGRFSGPVFTATALTAPSGVSDVALNLSGVNHACAITGAGAAWCWGGNNLNQLGHANTNDPACTVGTSKCNPTPQQVAGITDAADVFTTDAVSCVVTRTQTVMCWGFEGNGGLGSLSPGGPTPRRVPVLPEMLNGSGFRLHLCGRSSLSDAWCWGPNGKGQLGNGTLTGGFNGHACTCSPPVQTVPAMRVRSIAAGDEFSLAVKLDGTVWAWGFNPDGRIGHMPMTQGDLNCADNSVCNPVPKQIMGLP